ncbi:MAG: hypothetical protein J6R08_08170 [Opitutales bacterium]|nr:hypothetical protein [Opitutales bacterium]
MIQDIYDPLEKYRFEFREKFAELAQAKFEELAQKSGIDAKKNHETTQSIAGAKKELSSQKNKLLLKVFLILLLVVGLAISGYLAYKFGANADGIRYGVICATCILLLFLTGKSLSKTSKHIEELKFQVRIWEREAWAQMRPLNELYTWDIPVKLIEKTVPKLAFDPYFTASRLANLKRQFGWDDSFNENKSILFAQSGEINGNAFAIGEYMKQNWGSKTYTGEKQITWTQWVVDTNGKSRLVTKSQVLTASVTKPIPVYQNEKILIYGNDAAPNLKFSRNPSEFSNNDGLFNSIRKKMELRRLKKFSQNLDDDSQYTLMSNHEFETLFHAKDRNNEVEFRLLFTALAQTQILKIMKDQNFGYGDDFSFKKQGKINLISAKHLDDAPIDTNPERFQDFDFYRAKRNFLEFNEKYFKDIYFAFAPLLSIPLYQQTRTHEDIYNENAKQLSFWEHEAIANFYGDSHFKHPQCVTRSILKTTTVSHENGVSKILVSAHGFRTQSHISYVKVFGGDGKWHNVAVEWDEYLPICGSSLISVAESEDGRKIKTYKNNAHLRRNIYSWLERD